MYNITRTISRIGGHVVLTKLIPFGEIDNYDLDFYYNKFKSQIVAWGCNNYQQERCFSTFRIGDNRL